MYGESTPLFINDAWGIDFQSTGHDDCVDMKEPQAPPRSVKHCIHLA
ncbi:hypothetical protein [Thermocladium modestius]|nr:hypothetical protein [Thermocladium modestius]